MGSYGIGVGRLLACVAEEHRDDSGLKLPINVAPYQVYLVVLARADETAEQANLLYRELSDAGLEVLFDDRPVSAGIKFADGDLLGIPIRVLISDRSLKNEEVELKLRRESDPFKVPRQQAVGAVTELVNTLLAEVDNRLAAFADQNTSAKDVLG